MPATDDITLGSPDAAALRDLNGEEQLEVTLVLDKDVVLNNDPAAMRQLLGELAYASALRKIGRGTISEDDPWLPEWASL